MTAKQLPGTYAPDGSLYITLTDGAGTLSTGASPGGSTTQLQYNNAGAFGGTSGLTWDSTNKVVSLATVASNGNEGALIINGNAVAPTTADAHRTSIHIIAEDTGLPEIMFDGYGSHGSINFRNSGGTGGSPAFTPTGSDIFRIGARGRGTSVLTNTSAGLRAITAENFTDTANGTFLTLSSTALGAAGNSSGGTEAWRVQPSGGASIGDSTFNALDSGAGVLAVKNGILLGTKSILPTGILYSKVTVDFNVGNTDTAIPITLPAGFTRYRVGPVGSATGIGEISGASASISTATFGVFTATGGGGTAITNAGTAITVTTASENTSNNSMAISANITPALQSFNVGTLYFRVGTAQGSAATGTVIIAYMPVS